MGCSSFCWCTESRTATLQQSRQKNLQASWQRKRKNHQQSRGRRMRLVASAAEGCSRQVQLVAEGAGRCPSSRLAGRQSQQTSRQRQACVAAARHQSSRREGQSTQCRAAGRRCGPLPWVLPLPSLPTKRWRMRHKGWAVAAQVWPSARQVAPPTTRACAAALLVVALCSRFHCGPCWICQAPSREPAPSPSPGACGCLPATVLPYSTPPTPQPTPPQCRQAGRSA